MALQRCANGHVYDTAKHDSCPVCGQGPDVSRAGPKRTAAEHSRPHTIGRDDALQPGSRLPPTEIGYESRIGIDPVCGWLVCINGPDRGRDYRIYAETNSIGRAETMRICIAGDKQVSRENHAFVIFDPASNKFYISPGNAQGLAYHNRQLVNEATELRPFDEIKLGGTTLLFVPFVGEFGAPNFQWA